MSTDNKIWPPAQFANREARFYRNVGWSGMQWVAGNANVKTNLQYYTNGQNAWPSANNVPPTGYLAFKWYAPTISPLQRGASGFARVCERSGRDL